MLAAKFFNINPSSDAERHEKMIRSHQNNESEHQNKKLFKLNSPKTETGGKYFQRTVINVSGLNFEINTETLARFPKTLLGNSEKRKKYFDDERKEYFFDRHRQSFESILYYYQSNGELKRPHSIPLEVFYEEIKFFELEEEIIEKFCQDENYVREYINILPQNAFQRKVWIVFEYPRSSILATCTAICSVIVTTISIALVCVESMPQYRFYKLTYVNNTKTEMLESQFNEDGIPKVTDPFFIIETVCTTWFMFELFGRFISSPQKLIFCNNFMNVIDILAIIPYFIGLVTILIGDEQGQDHSIILSVLRLVRLIRVFRIFKLSRYSKGMQILGNTLKASINELLLLVFFLMINSVLVSSLIYFTESDAEYTYFHSIPEALWWSIITMTTVGYGDMFPVTIWGKLLGGLCAIIGLLTLSLPVPVIVSNFNFYYHRATEEQTKQVYMHVGETLKYRRMLKDGELKGSLIQMRNLYVDSSDDISKRKLMDKETQTC